MYTCKNMRYRPARRMQVSSSQHHWPRINSEWHPSLQGNQSRYHTLLLVYKLTLSMRWFILFVITICWELPSKHGAISRVNTLSPQRNHPSQGPQAHRLFGNVTCWLVPIYDDEIPPTNSVTEISKDEKSTSLIHKNHDPWNIMHLSSFMGCLMMFAICVGS